MSGLIPVEYTFNYFQDDEELEGAFGYMAEGENAEAIAHIRKQLDEGNDCAWCFVVVTASVTFDGETFTGKDSIGGCSYESEHALRADLEQEMRFEAWSNLCAVLGLAAHDKRHLTAARILAEGLEVAV